MFQALLAVAEVAQVLASFFCIFLLVRLIFLLTNQCSCYIFSRKNSKLEGISACFHYFRLVFFSNFRTIYPEISAQFPIFLRTLSDALILGRDINCTDLVIYNMQFLVYKLAYRHGMIAVVQSLWRDSISEGGIFDLTIQWKPHHNALQMCFVNKILCQMLEGL